MLPFPKLPKINTDNLDFSNVRHDVVEQRVRPVLDRYKSERRQKRVKWLKDNCIGLLTLAVAIITLIATILK